MCPHAALFMHSCDAVSCHHKPRCIAGINDVATPVYARAVPSDTSLPSDTAVTAHRVTRGSR